MPSFLSWRFEPSTSKKLAILEAARAGSLERVRALLVEDPRLVRITDNNGTTALHYAAALGHQAAVDALLLGGAEINAKDNEGGSPLHHAASNGHVEVVESLLKGKATVDAETAVKRWTPLHLAAEKGHKKVAELLLAYNAEVSRATEPRPYT